jgi:hypothetical protein
MESSRHSALGVVLGVATFGALTSGLFALANLAVPSAHSPWPHWYSTAQPITEALASVAPGFIAGVIGRGAGFKLGFIVGLLCAVFSVLVAGYFWGGLPSDRIGYIALVAVATNIVTQSVGGLAGQAFRSSRFAL